MDDEWAEYYRIGQDNQVVIELSRRHCQRMEFVEWGGRGMLESATGLPINMRRIRCPKSNDSSASMRLEGLAVAFYRENCIGCELRKPTGELPSLSTFVAESDAADEAARMAEEGRREIARAAWHARSEQRRSTAVGADPAMIQALDDLALLDPDPGSSEVAAGSDGLRRLSKLAERAPQTFSTAVVEVMLTDLEVDTSNGLFGPLRMLASSRDEIRPRLIELAIGALESRPDVEAARILVQFSDEVDAVRFTPDLVHALIVVSFGLQIDGIGHLAPNRASDPAALLLAAQQAPETLITVLEDMLPGEPSGPTLALPPGSTARRSTDRDPARERGAAASALDHLLLTHPSIAARLTHALIRNAVVPGDRYDRFPDGRVSRTLAHFLARDVGDARVALQRAGESAGDDQRERLFRAWTNIARLLEPDRAHRDIGDPELGEDVRAALFDTLTDMCLSMVGGRWGHEVAFQAAEAIERMAAKNPGWAYPKRDAYLGAALTALQAKLNVAPSLIITPAESNPLLASMEADGRRVAFNAAAQRLFRAVSSCAATDPIAVAQSLADCIAYEREADLEIELRWFLLPIVGDVGAQHASHGGVLPVLLPILYTYLVDSSPALRARAIEAWARIAHQTALPSTLEDLLPILVEDQHVIVATALYSSVPGMAMSPSGEQALLRSAVELCLTLPKGTSGDLLKAVIGATRYFSRAVESSRSAVELLALSRASELDGYDLERILHLRWSRTTSESEQMARLRLRLVGDPQINDRFNQHDDELLVALLEVGAGLRGLPLDDLIATALSFGPESVLAGLEIAEVAWRAARGSDARTIAEHLRDSLPTTAAFDSQRNLVELVLTALTADGDPTPRRAHTDIPETGDSDALAGLAHQHQLRQRARRLLYGEDAEDSAKPPDRANNLVHVAQDLEKSSRRATPTAAYARSFAGLCRVAASLLRLDTALEDGAKDDVALQQKSLQRLTKTVKKQLRSSFTDDDPLANRMMKAIADIKTAIADAQIPELLAGWSQLSVPLAIVEGAPLDRGRSRPHPRREHKDPTPTAVVLVSVNDQLLTGPAVLAPHTVYELKVEVQPDQWPSWAERLDLEFVGPIGPSEIQLPTMSWPRPSEPDIGQTFEATGTLVLRFGLPAGRLAPGFVVHLRWHGQLGGSARSELLDIAGHAQIRLRPYDASRDAITQYSSVDERLLTLYASLPDAGFQDTEIQAFCRFFTAVCREGFRLTWDRRYRRGQRVTEKSFHDDLFAMLLADADLEGRVERGTPVGLGFLDLRHDGITAELKVERRTAVTRDSAPKYMGQPTQYAAADGKRLSILAILDMSPKSLPIGSAENYIFTLHPFQHGLDNPEAPSMVAAVVVNGNLPTPSSWSRRKPRTNRPRPDAT